MLHIEALENRLLLSTIGVNATQVVRTVDNQVLGVNLATWDSYLGTSQTASMVEAAGLTAFRMPGGSESDNYHFNVGPTWNTEGTAANMAQFVSTVNGVGMVTVNYGTGSPQEAAAWLAYLDAPTNSTVQIGYGEEWNSATNTWQQVNWQTAGYWASLRAAKPLATDDGLNFLRIGRSAPFNIHYFEVGNEIYGSWETDEHGSGGDAGQPHDPGTYIAFAKTFSTLAQEISPGVSLGIDGDGPDTWMADCLQKCVADGFTPGFISDHNYMQQPGSESDSFLLQDTVSDAASSLSWASRSSGYRSQLSEYLGSAGNSVELLATEYNSVAYNPGKQTTSLVNGLFAADSIGAMLETSYDGGYFWDLRNGWQTGDNNSASLYGWRQGGDYGMIGSDGTSPATGDYVPYPTYFAEELASKIAVNGASVLKVTGTSSTFSTYAVLESDGDIDLLVINKSSSATQTATFSFTGFQPNGQASIWQYGEAQDTAQSQTSNGAAALAYSTQTLSVSGASVSMSFPAYSMTVIELGKATPPAVTGENYTLSNSAFAVQFNENVSANLNAGDLTLTNLATGVPVPVGDMAEAYNSNTNTATFTFPGYAGGVLPNGVYEAVLNAAAITNSFGQSLTGASAYYFLLVNPGQVLNLAGNAQTYTVQQFIIGVGGTLDIGSDTIVIPYASGSDPATAIGPLLTSGFDSGSWGGIGITSSVASDDARDLTGVGYFDSGQTVTITPVLYGDANLDGSVNADDASLILAGQAKGGTRWQDGNFNYSAHVDDDDWSMLLRSLAMMNAGESARVQIAQSPASVKANALPPLSTSDTDINSTFSDTAVDAILSETLST